MYHNSVLIEKLPLSNWLQILQNLSFTFHWKDFNTGSVLPERKDWYSMNEQHFLVFFLGSLHNVIWQQVGRAMFSCLLMVDNEGKENKIKVLRNLVPTLFVADLLGISQKMCYRKTVTVTDHSGLHRDLYIIRWTSDWVVRSISIFKLECCFHVTF